MNQTRRKFLYNSSISTLAFTAFGQSVLSCNSKPNTNDQNGIIDHISKFGIQLWTVKEDMAKDPKGTLKLLADYGYKQIESFTGEKGIFWGMTAHDFKNYTSDLGLEVISSHVNPDFTTKPETEAEFKKLLEDAAHVGLKYVINPFPGELKTIDEWKQVAEGLNRQGEISKEFGIKTAYHNHHFEFLPTSDGQLPEKVMLDGTDAQLVDFELDLYWIVKAGHDPQKWISDYKNRYRLVHVKDLYPADKIAEIEKNEKPDGDFWPLGASTTLGNGVIDFSHILQYAKVNGVEQFIVEQERFDGSTALDDAKINSEYMKALKLAKS